MTTTQRVALGVTRLAIRRAVSDASLAICAEDHWSSVELDKLFRVEKHAVRELAFFLIEGAA